MFISNKICFVEFGKTGCSFIREIFSKKIKDGVLTKIHDSITDELMLSDKIKVGSIRNPYDWYISLWSFGCLMQKRDPLFSNLTKRKLNPKRIINIKGNYKEKVHFLFDQFRKDINFNKELYSNPYNTDNFKNWIKLLFDNKKKNYIGEHYSISNTNKFIGYMTFHYLIRFTNKNFHHELFDKSLISYDDIKKFYLKNNYIDNFIVFEKLNESLVNLFNLIDLNVSEEDLNKEKPVNKSKRLPNIDEYFDEETKGFVKKYDALIFEMHNY